uniref:Calcium-binding tyrosine phosphorylation-regulated protein n=1 Tax=Pelodiscus sinensis TaxID=13735 RepID=K7FK25_PELSI|nr:calcium-binding tyrosine phosphorylation-regulated protein isoform X3 [Pelodiscus sinensis]|eukprot:XP_025037511.1 calcium-binding tyrosine phosphorylation-regulated protein isoform X3 [Pelodiscus sinensis]
MHSVKPRLVVPYGLKTLLEGVSRAVLKTSPSNITEFAALYFRELIAFREENPNLDITDLVREFHFTRVEGWTERLPEKRPDLGDLSAVSPLTEEPKRKEKSTDTEEDQLHEGPEPEYSSKTTQYPSTHSDLVENEPSPTGPESSPKGPELAYVPADPAQLAAQMLAMATTEAGQPPPYSNVWTLYCLTDLNQQGRKSPPPLPPAGTGAPYPQATLYISSGKEQQPFLQQQLPPQGPPPQVSSPTYVMEEGKRGNAPPFILVGSTVQNVQDWKSIPGHAVLAQHETSAVRRFTTVPIPVARPADLKMATPSPNSNSAQETARPPTPVFLSVAIPLDDVMAAKRGAAGDKQTGINPFAGSYGIAGEITFTSGPVRRADS